MRKLRIGGALAGIAIAALALTACNSGTPGAEPGATNGGGDEETSSTPWTVATDVTIDGSPTFDAITERGKVKVGVKEDQPGLGYLDPVTNERTGFDVHDQVHIRAKLKALRDEAIATQRADGGTLTEAHKAELNGKLALIRKEACQTGVGPC